MKPSARSLPVLVAALALATAALAAACGSSDDQTPPPSAPSGSNDPHDPGLEVLPDPLAGMPKGADQLKTVCARGADDAVTEAFCGNKPASVTSIVELQEALGLGFKDRTANGDNGAHGNPAFALLGHSTSLVARSVSAINPRAFVFDPPPGQPARILGFTIMGFARGEPFVEVAAEDPNQRSVTFYLIRFELACESSGGCTAGDLLTPAVEKNWKSVSIYAAEDLKDTIVDCRECHQPKGPNTGILLRMQELQDPWTHWFRSDRPGGVALQTDFHRAHGFDEDYAGIPAAIMDKADGKAMEDFVTGQGFQNQPNVFDSKTIEQEVDDSDAAQPDVNMPAGTSATWDQIYDASVEGQFIPVPYHDVKVTDPDKLAYVSDAYLQVQKGTQDAKNLPDIRRVFLDDALPEMSMRPKVGATGDEILVQMCSQCHNGRLDQTLSRAHFDATNLSGMNAGQKASAIARMKLDPSDIHHMPPAMFRTIPDDQLQLAIQALSQ